jgi:DNA polymerase III delta prime subunit
MANFFNHQFFANPFYKTYATDREDLETMVLLDNHRKIKTQVLMNIKQPIRILLCGERGIGKSLAMLYIKKEIEEQHDPKIIIFESTGLDASFSSLRVFIQKLNYKVYQKIDIEEMEKTIVHSDSVYEKAKKLDEYIADIRVVLFIDVPDAESRYKHFDTLAEILDVLLCTKQVTIIFSLNTEQMKKFGKSSSILNKFSEIPLRKLDFEEAKSMIEKRLQKFRENGSTGTHPFTDDTIMLVQDMTIGLPRAILKSCERLFIESDETNKTEINKEFAMPILNKHYAEDLIIMNESDLTLRSQFFKICSVLKNKYGGKCEKKMTLIRDIMGAINVSEPCAIDKLRKLEGWGVLSVARDEGNMKAKTVFLRAR